MGRATQRAIDILELIAGTPDGRTHAEISRELDIPKSTMTDLLKDLVDRQYLELRRGGQYLIGPRALIISRAYLQRLDVVSVASDILISLRDEVGEAVVLMVRHDLEMVVVAKENSHKPLVATMIIGDRGPVVSTAGGKAMLAFLGEDMIDQIIAETLRRGIGTLKPLDVPALKAELASIRHGGLAFSREEWLEGIIGIGMPVLGADGPIGAISFGAPMMRMTQARIVEIEPILRRAVNELSARLAGVSIADFKPMHRIT